MAAPAQAHALAHPVRNAHAWLRDHDRGYAATRRAVRAAVVMPAMFALGDQVIANPVLATFAAFGSFAMLLLVDFSGSIADRLVAQASLGVACAALICLGTLVSRETWLAAVAMAVVAFAILFAGVVSSVLASATTSLLLAFILPVSLPGPMSSIPDRVAGWGLAAAVSLLAISLLWPAPARNPVRTLAIDASRALAARLRAEVAYRMSPGAADAQAAYTEAVSAADAAVEQLHTLFFATPYRPTGLSTDTRAVVRLVDELRWLNDIVLRGAPGHPVPHHVPTGQVKLAAAEVLEGAAQLLAQPRKGDADLVAARARMRAALTELEQATIAVLPSAPPEDGAAPADDAAASAAGNGEMTHAHRIVSSLNPSFRAQELSFVTAQIANNVEFAAAAVRRSWVDRLLGRQPEGFEGALTSASARAGAHFRRTSVWLHNSVRGAVALGLAVLVADVSGVQHGFWVVFGTLSVLRSNALSTGQNIVRALAGTTAGFVVGGVLVYLIGTDTTVLWVLLPIAILIAGLAPATVSFTAGQAGFTLTLVILFNIIAPAGWKVGLVRVEDIALGGAVSLVIGLAFWPRGAGAALGRALSEAYVNSVRYLSDAVAYGVSCCDAGGPPTLAPRAQALEAAAAARRLDDTFREYLAERGSKPVSLSEVTGLVTGVAGLRLAGDAVLDLWDGDGGSPGERAGARRELLSAAGDLSGWYDRFASSLTGGEPVPDPLAADRAADERLVEAVGRDLRGDDGQTTATGVRVIWTGDHIDAARRLQEFLVGPAREAVAEHALTRDGSRVGRRLP